MPYDNTDRNPPLHITVRGWMVFTYWLWQSNCQNISLTALRPLLSDQVCPSREESHRLLLHQSFIWLWCPISPSSSPLMHQIFQGCLKPLALPTTDCSLSLHPPDMSASLKSFLISSCVPLCPQRFIPIPPGWEAFHSTLLPTGSVSMLPTAQHQQRLICSTPPLPR